MVVVPVKYFKEDDTVSETKVLAIVNELAPIDSSDIALELVKRKMGDKLTMESYDCLASNLHKTKVIVWRLISRGILDIRDDDLKIVKREANVG
jgi:hypothetical protein